METTPSLFGRLKQARHAEEFRHQAGRFNQAISLASGVLKQVQHDIFNLPNTYRDNSNNGNNNKMKLKILSSSYVGDFLDVNFISTKIEASLESEFYNVVEKITNENLKNWTVQFIFRYNNVRQILIYTKGKSYSIEKYKEITIHLPIPTVDIAKWGVNQNQHVYDTPGHLDDKINNFERLDVDFSLFDNRTDYLTDCMRRAMQFCFENGFTINKVKIQTKNPSSRRFNAA